MRGVLSRWVQTGSNKLKEIITYIKNKLKEIMDKRIRKGIFTFK
jgi:hypothetical protein